MPFSEALTICHNPFWIPKQKWCCKPLKLRKTVGKEDINTQQRAAVLVLNQQQYMFLIYEAQCHAPSLRSSFTPEKPHRTLSLHGLIQTLNAKHAPYKRDSILKDKFYHEKIKSPLERKTMCSLMSFKKILTKAIFTTISSAFKTNSIFFHLKNSLFFP